MNHHAHHDASAPSSAAGGHAHRDPHAGHDGQPPQAPDQHAQHHDKHAGHSVEMFRRKFWVSLLLTVPTLLWGHVLPAALGYTPPHVPGAHQIPAIAGTLVFLVGGWPFLHGAVKEIVARAPGMMTLISLAISVAFGFSLAVTFGYAGTPLWEELATLVTIMLLGHWVEMRSMRQASGALAELSKLMPDTAVRVDGERLDEVPLAALRDGDVVLVRPGQSVPADGLVRDGASTVNESMITANRSP